MARATQIAFLGSEFDAFLFAPIGESGNGMPLTVLSALARQNVDPWQEAANLARLPREAATQRLTSWLAALSGGLSADRESGTIAARLIALLPHRVVVSPPLNLASIADGRIKVSRPVTVFVIFMAFLIGVQFVIAMGQSSAQIGNAGSSAGAIVSSQTPAPIPGR